MKSAYIRNHKVVIELWTPKVRECAEDLKQQSGCPAGVWPHARAELRIYGLSLATAYERLEDALGTPNPRRLEAASEYLDALQRADEIRDEGRDGAVIGSYSIGPPTPLTAPWEQRVEEADRKVDEALLRYADEHP